MPFTKFYDSAQPQNVPSGSFAAVYVNGYKWPVSEIHRMGHVIGVSVESDPRFARWARVLDIENGAASPKDAVPFLEHRLSHGHHDGTLYVNRGNWQQVYDLCHAAGHYPRFWVATLDGSKDPNGPGMLWAVQYEGGGSAPYDVSVLRGANDFSPAKTFTQAP